MDREFAQQMSELTSEFYRRVSASFSSTRQAPWPGWRRVVDVTGYANASSLRVIDVACGNLRFERFLCESGAHVEAWAYDNCEALVDDAGTVDGLDVHFACVDMARALLEGSYVGLPPEGACDLGVSFGFAHHLPLEEQRSRLLGLLASRVRHGGYVVVAFWQFEDDERIRAKARRVEGGSPHDYLLGWQNVPDVWRYCHHAADDEIDRLTSSVAHVAREIARFSADGRSGLLNRYAVLQVR